VSQISPPIRIVLAVAAIFLVAWLLVLRPKSDAVVATPPAATPAGNLANGTAAVSGPGKLAQKAENAVNTANANQEADAGEAVTPTPSTGTATKPSATAPAAKPIAAADDVKGLPQPVTRAIATNKILVLLFYKPDVRVDRDVHQAVRKVDRWGGRVFVQSVPAARVGRFARITSGAAVDQSPSVVVVDRDLHATTIAGFTDTASIDQAVVDALRNSGGLFTSGYLREVNDVCSRFERGFLTLAQPATASEVPAFAQRSATRYAAFTAGLRGIPAPARYQRFKTASVADAAALTRVMKGWSKALGTRPSAAKVNALGGTYGARSAPISKRLTARMDARHVLSCAN
jgi:hypothetical protein